MRPDLGPDPRAVAEGQVAPAEQGESGPADPRLVPPEQPPEGRDAQDAERRREDEVAARAPTHNGSTAQAIAKTAIIPISPAIEIRTGPWR